MVQFASYVRRVLHKTRLIFSRINGPNVMTNYIVNKGTGAQKKLKSIDYYNDNTPNMFNARLKRGDKT